MLFIWIDPQGWVPVLLGLRVDLILFPAWLLYCFVSGKFSLTKWTIQHKVFLYWVAWIIISILVNEFGQHSSRHSFDYFKWFVMFVLVVSTLSSINYVKKTVIVMVFFALFLSVEGIQHKLSYDGLGWAGQALGWVDASVLTAGGTGRIRWTGIFDGPGVFCLVFTMALPFLLSYLHKPYNWIIRLLALGSAGVMSVAIYYTGSRGGLITVLVLLTLHFYQKIEFRFLKFLKYLIIPIALVAVVTIAPSHMTNLDDQNRSASNRVEMWAYGVDMVQHNPVFGVGRGNFINYTYRLIAHNSAVEIMAETGVVGLLTWITLIYISFKILFQFYRQSNCLKEKALATALGNSIVGYLVSASFVTLEYEIFYFLLALTAVFGKSLEEPISINGSDIRRIFMITGGFIVGLKIFIMVYQTIF